MVYARGGITSVISDIVSTTSTLEDLKKIDNGRDAESVSANVHKRVSSSSTKSVTIESLRIIL